MVEKKYFIGIDFGHGETSVSRVPGYNNEPVSRVPLRVTSHDVDKKVISAICRHDNGEWHYVWTEEDFVRPNMIEGFKGIVSKLTPEEKDALAIFAKLIFRTIIENDQDLQYDETTGQANFSICIACPSDWRRQDPSTPDEYRRFFHDECGIIPIEMCINESDAAFYTKYNDYVTDDTIFVIDLGSSTIDFTSYHHAECVEDCCWGHNLGAHLVEDRLLNVGYRNPENIENMRKVASERKKAGLGSADAALSLAARFAKEDYFTNHRKRFNFRLSMADLYPVDDYTTYAFNLILTKEEFDEVISDYRNQLQAEFENAAKKLLNYNIIPNIVLLSGGASRMDFVRDCAEKAFPNSNIYKDINPEWVVSDGAAKYAEVYYKALEESRHLKDEFLTWARGNLDDELKVTVIDTFNSILKETLRQSLEEKYLNNSNGSLNSFESIVKDILERITKTLEFKTKAETTFVTLIDNVIKTKLENIIFSNYGKKISINENFINPGDTFDDINVKTEYLHDLIGQIADAHCNNIFEGIDDLDWSKERSLNKRQKIINTYLSMCDYDSFEHKIDMEEFMSQAVSKIDTILRDNGLFVISVNIK
jgi:hypothetical protein